MLYIILPPSKRVYAPLQDPYLMEILIVRLRTIAIPPENSRRSDTSNLRSKDNLREIKIDVHKHVLQRKI